MTDQQEQSTDLNIGRDWLNRAAEMLDSCEDHLSDAEFARAAAAIGTGFVQLAAVEQVSAWRAEDLDRLAADRDEERENDEVVREVNRLALERERRELAPRLELFDAVAEREQRAADEARPHDDEPKHATDDGVIWVVADCNGAIHGAVSQQLAQQWAAENEGDYEGLSVTALAVDRG